MPACWFSLSLPSLPPLSLAITHAVSCSLLYPWQLGGLSRFRQHWRGASFCPPLPPPSSSSTFPVTNAPTLFLFSAHQFLSLTTLFSRAVCAGLLGLCTLCLIMLKSHKHPLMKRLELSLLCCCFLLCKDSKFNTKQIGTGNFKSDPNVIPMPIHF